MNDGSDKDVNTDSCVAISVVDVPRSVPHQVASLPRLNESLQTRFAGHERVRGALIGQKKERTIGLEYRGNPLTSFRAFLATSADSNETNA